MILGVQATVPSLSTGNGPHVEASASLASSIPYTETAGISHRFALAPRECACCEALSIVPWRLP